MPRPPRLSRLAALPLIAALSACGGAEGPARYPVPVPAEAAPLRIQATSVEVRDVTLPLYAGLEEIWVLDATGALRSDTEILWADNPRASITQGLASALAARTDKPVAAEPWPFDAYPDVRLDVRFEELMADAGGLLVARGQYFVAPVSGETDPVAELFDLTERFNPEDLNSLAAARGRLVARLAETIARGGL